MPVLNNEALDDPLLHELCADYSGGQASFPKPDVLAQNQAAYLKNCYIHYSGMLRKRRGTRNLEDGFVDSQNKRIQGGLFYKTNLVDKLLAVSNGKIFEYLESTNTWELYIDASINNINEQVDVVQLTDNIFWTDSAEDGIRMWDGTTMTLVPSSPAAQILISFTNRLIASGDPLIPDGIYFSDFLDGESWGVTNILRVGAEGDPIVALKPWQDHYLLVFKEKSTWVIDISPVISVAQFSIQLVHSSIGCAGKRTLAQVGQDVFFLSRAGIMSVQKQLATSNNVVPVPISHPVTDIIDRVNWEQAHKASALFYKNQYMCMLPVDSEEPDTAIVYSYLQQAWAGVWGGPKGVFLMEQPYQGSTRIIMGTDDGQVKTSRDTMSDSEDLPDSYIDTFGAISLPATLDAYFPPGSQVDAELLTRSMFFGEAFNPKTGWYLEAEFQSKEADLELYVILDGADQILLDAWSFTTLGSLIPFDLPLTLQPARWVRKKYPLFQLGRFRSIQVRVKCPRGNMILRSLYLCAFVDSIELNQTITVL